MVFLGKNIRPRILKFGLLHTVLSKPSHSTETLDEELLSRFGLCPQLRERSWSFRCSLSCTLPRWLHCSMSSKWSLRFGSCCTLPTDVPGIWSQLRLFWDVICFVFTSGGFLVVKEKARPRLRVALLIEILLILHYIYEKSI